jgi:hypothetical protein
MNFIIVGDIILDHNIYTTIQNPACFNKLTIENVRGIFLLCDKKYNFKHKKITTYDKLTRLHNRLGDMLNALKNESAAGK